MQTLLGLHGNLRDSHVEFQIGLSLICTKLHNFRRAIKLNAQYISKQSRRETNRDFGIRKFAPDTVSTCFFSKTLSLTLTVARNMISFKFQLQSLKRSN